MRQLNVQPVLLCPLIDRPTDSLRDSLTQVNAEHEACTLELQGDVVALLPLPVEQHAVARTGPELQGDEVREELDLLRLTTEAVRDDTLAVETDDIRPCVPRDERDVDYSTTGKSIRQGVCKSCL